MTRYGILAVAAAALLAVALAAPPALASADVSRHGTCDAGNRWKLDLTDHGARIEVEFEVDQHVAGQTWRVRLSDNGNVFFRGTRTTDADGSFSVDRRTRDRAGTDRIVGRARNLSTGEVCRGVARI